MIIPELVGQTPSADQRGVARHTAGETVRMGKRVRRPNNGCPRQRTGTVGQRLDLLGIDEYVYDDFWINKEGE